METSGSGLGNRRRCLMVFGMGGVVDFALV